LPAPGATDALLFVDGDGRLVHKNNKDNSVSVVLAGNFFIESFAVNEKEQLVAAVAHFKDPDDARFLLYNAATGELTVIGDHAIVGLVSWSPGGRYLVLDRGTYVWRGIEIYDVATGIPRPVEVGIWATYIWSPDGNRLLDNLSGLIRVESEAKYFTSPGAGTIVWAEEFFLEKAPAGTVVKIILSEVLRDRLGLSSGEITVKVK